MTRAVLTGQGASPQRLPSAHLTTLSFAISLGLYTALEISSPYPSSVTPHEELTLTLIPLLPQSLSPTVLAGQGAFPTLPPLSMKGAHELCLDGTECTFVSFSYNPCGPGSVSNTPPSSNEGTHDPVLFCFEQKIFFPSMVAAK